MNLTFNHSLHNYDLHTCINQGSSGAVYQATDHTLQREVAIKVVHSETQQQFLQAARIQASLNHPAIMPLCIADIDSASGNLYVVMPLMQGSLQDMLAPPLDPHDVVRLLTPIADALDCIHDRNLLHCDITPHTILVDHNNRPYLTNFGLVKDMSIGQTTEQIIGTEQYMAPEQFTPPIHLTPACDIYAFGLVAYFLLTATLPFTQPKQRLAKNPLPLRRAMPSLSQAVNDAVLHALHRSPSQRYARASELITALHAAITETETVSVVPPSPAAPTETTPAQASITIAPLATIVQAVAAYLHAVETELQRGSDTEHTYRPFLKTLFEACAPGVDAINEPRRIACGAPDLLLETNDTPLGYIEAKIVGTDLARIVNDSEHPTPRTNEGKQLARYRTALTNLLFTDGLAWYWFVEGTSHLDSPVQLGHWNGSRLVADPNAVQAFADLYSRFLTFPVPSVTSPHDLARRMAQLARLLDAATRAALADTQTISDVHDHRDAMCANLLPGLSDEAFADLYAQTITYGLFAARTIDPDGPFTLPQATYLLPSTIPFLKKLFSEIAGPNLDDALRWVVDDLVRLLAATNVQDVMAHFGSATMQHDPIIHFYETFLAAYDPSLRESRGVYYTPAPVVDYLVRSVNHLLKTNFHYASGLADERVFILDPATGTGTFLSRIVRNIHQTITRTMAGVWESYVDEKLLPRLFGFELLMAPYIIAHLNLTVVLRDLGAPMKNRQRASLYLTNALADAPPAAALPGFGRFIVREAHDAADVKHEKPVMVVIGNPPYAVSSVNRSDWITHLMDRYKQAVRSEANIQPLSDDYIKFIRFAQWRIEQTGHGIVAFITNHSYLSGLIHRGMRHDLCQTFDTIYILNLHGNSLIGERAPDGTADENVFDIQQGVALGIFVRTTGEDGPRQATVHYADMWGRRAAKYDKLTTHDVSTTTWETLTPVAPNFFFVPGADAAVQAQYEQGTSVTDIFSVYSAGIKTHRDHFVIALEQQTLTQRINEFINASLSDEDIAHRHRLRDNRDWSLSQARRAVRSDAQRDHKRTHILYRAYDTRPIFYSKDVIDFPRFAVMHHMLSGNNIALLSCRQQALPGFYHVLCATTIVDSCAVSLKTREITTVFPLYLYPTEQEVQGGLYRAGERRANLSPDVLTTIAAATGMSSLPDGAGDGSTTFGPEDIFHYIYAVLHSPAYRTRYAKLLKIDFPRIPVPPNAATFWTMVGYGAMLVDLHLLRLPGAGGVGGAGGAPALVTPSITYPVAGNNHVERVRYTPHPTDTSTGWVTINDTQYFSGVVPAVWSMQIGGYQPARKWLEDRKRRTLSFDDIQHYTRIITALQETQRLMDEIDTIFDIKTQEQTL